MNNRDTLKEQLIASMEQRLGRLMAESVFRCDIWPVLDAAMTAGELLVARNTKPQQPVNTSIQTWLDGCLGVVQRVHAAEATVSKRELLNLLYGLEKGAIEALRDAKLIDSWQKDPGSGTCTISGNMPQVWMDEAAQITDEQIEAKGRH